MSISKVRELQNSQQQSGEQDARRFLIVLLAILCVWFGTQQLQARMATPSQTAAAVHTTAVTTSKADVTFDHPVAAAKGASFGRWGIVAEPMLFLLTWVQAHIVRNWGWAIVVLTGVINLALWPTRAMSLRSTLKMQHIQPQMEAIKLRYKGLSVTDPKQQGMQREMMELRKSEGISTFGGCLPTLLTWPLMVGFYKMLAGATVLRGAPWLWLHDLASADPLHVLPVLVVVSMAASQLLTPTPGIDATQRRLMALAMPLVFGVFAWKYAAGLSLYFVCSNFCWLFQQIALRHTSTGREIARQTAVHGLRA
jgi:YidC/Oxa1 family membrane protein insertase